MQKSNNLTDLSPLPASIEGLELIEATLLNNVAGAAPGYTSKCTIRCLQAD